MVYVFMYHIHAYANVYVCMYIPAGPDPHDGQGDGLADRRGGRVLRQAVPAAGHRDPGGSDRGAGGPHAHDDIIRITNNYI